MPCNRVDFQNGSYQTIYNNIIAAEFPTFKDAASFLAFLLATQDGQDGETVIVTNPQRLN